MGQRRTHHAGFAVMQAAHGIEQMGEAGSALLQRLHTVLVTAQGVADLHPDTGIAQRTDDLHMAGNFRCQRQQRDGGQLTQLVDLRQHGTTSIVRLGTQLARIDVRAFQMHAQQPCRAGGALTAARPQRGQHVFNLVHWRSHSGGQHGGGAMLRMQPGNRFGRAAAFHDVYPAAAVYMQVDKAGQDVTLYRAARGQPAIDGGDAAIRTQGNRAVQPAIAAQDAALQYMLCRHRLSSATKS